MKDLKKRLEAVEQKQAQKPPLDIIGRYYDTLSEAEKRRYWRYIYGDSVTMEKAERLEMEQFSKTLHFECELCPGDYSFPELEAFDAWLHKGTL